MLTYYLGTARDGRVIARESRNPNYTHAAVTIDRATSRSPNFSTSPETAVRNFHQAHSTATPCEIVEVRKVTRGQYEAAKPAKAPPASYAVKGVKPLREAGYVRPTGQPENNR